MDFGTLASHYFTVAKEALNIQVGTQTNLLTGETKPFFAFHVAVFLIATAIEYLLKSLQEQEGKSSANNHNLASHFYRLESSTQEAIDRLNSEWNVRRVLGAHNKINIDVRYLSESGAFWDLDALASVYQSIAKYWSDTYGDSRNQQSPDPEFAEKLERRYEKFAKKIKEARK